MNLFTKWFALLCFVQFLNSSLAIIDLGLKLKLELQLKLNARYDFIVVGGGSSGATVASRLSENPNVRVLLLEAGGYPSILSYIPAFGPKLLNGPMDWNYAVQPQNNCFLSYPNRQCRYHAGKALGGGSSINVMMYTRGNARDYDRWNASGNTGWSWNDVRPYFLKSEGNTVPGDRNDGTYHNTDGPLTVSRCPYHTPSLQNFLQSGVENGYSIRDVNGPIQTGATEPRYVLKKGRRHGTYSAFIKPPPLRLNLVVLTGFTVTKVVFDGNKRATGVIARTPLFNAKRYVRASKEVILCAGAIQSPKILLQSGVGPQADLQALNIPVVVNRPGVGANLQDHVGCGVAIFRVNCSDCTYNAQTAMSPLSIIQFLFGKGPLTLPFAVEGLAFVNTETGSEGDDWPDVQMEFITASYLEDTQLASESLGISAEVLQQYLAPFTNSQTFSIFPHLLRPKSVGSVKLQSANYADQPLIDFNYLSHPDDIKVLVKAIKLAVKFGTSTAFHPLGAEFIPTVYPGCEAHVQYSDAYWECACRHFTMSIYHAVGTCKMGPASDPMAVVNPQLQVYNVSGLRVADDSIAPKIMAGTTMPPAIMIGEKAADMIKASWGL